MEKNSAEILRDIEAGLASLKEQFRALEEQVAQYKALAEKEAAAAAAPAPEEVDFTDIEIGVDDLPEVPAPAPAEILPEPVEMEFDDLPEADVEEPAPEPEVEEPAPEPVAEEPVPETVEEEAAPEPVIDEPVAEEPAPELEVEEPALEPVAEEPAPEPVVEEPVFEPVVEEPAPEPAPEPVAPQEAPAPAVPKVDTERMRWRLDKPGLPVKNIRSGISLYDRALFIGTLFKEDYALYDQTIVDLNTMASLDEAVDYLTARFPDWNLKSDIVYNFMMALRKKLG